MVAPDEGAETLVNSAEVIQKFGKAQVRQFLQGALKRASKGFSLIDLSYALHDDSHKRDARLAAVTVAFTRDWRPDWGGQLLFHDAEGQIERGFMPGFNVLTLFKVPKAHSVAPIAAYAATKRLSLTGWLVRQPAAGA